MIGTPGRRCTGAVPPLHQRWRRPAGLALRRPSSSPPRAQHAARTGPLRTHLRTLGQRCVQHCRQCCPTFAERTMTSYANHLVLLRNEYPSSRPNRITFCCQYPGANRLMPRRRGPTLMLPERCSGSIRVGSRIHASVKLLPAPASIALSIADAGEEEKNTPVLYLLYGHFPMYTHIFMNRSHC